MRELQDRIRAAVQTFDGNMLKRVWQELDYRIDICRVTKGADIEHLQTWTLTLLMCEIVSYFDNYYVKYTKFKSFKSF